MEPANLASDDQAELGELIMVLRSSRPNLFAGIILAMLMGTLAVSTWWWVYKETDRAGLSYMPLYHGRDWNWVAAGFVVVVGLVFAWFGWVILQKVRGMVGLEVDLHELGMRFRRREGNVTMPWERIAEVNEIVVSEKLPFLRGIVKLLSPTFKSSTYLVERDDGVSIEFGKDDLKDSDRLGEQLRVLQADYDFTWTVVERRG